MKKLQKRKLFTLAILSIPIITLQAQKIEKVLNNHIKEKEEIESFKIIFSAMTLEESKNVIKYLVAQKYRKKEDERINVARIFNRAVYYFNDLHLQQEALYHLMDMHYIGGSNIRGCYRKELFTEKTIARIVSIVKNGVTNDEIDLLLQEDLEEAYNYSDFEDLEIDEIVEKYNCSKKAALDTLQKREVQYAYNDFKYTKTPNGRLISFLGCIDRKEHASLLEKMLTEKRFTELHPRIRKGYEETIKTALAKLEYKNYMDTILVQYYDDFEIMRYLGKRNTYKYYIEKNNSLNVYKRNGVYDRERSVYTSKMSETVYNMISLIPNFPKKHKLRWPTVEKEEDIPNLLKKTKEAHQWLLENIESCKIDKRSCFRL